MTKYKIEERSLTCSQFQEPVECLIRSGKRETSKSRHLDLTSAIDFLLTKLEGTQT